LRRTVQRVSHEDGWEIIDEIEPGASHHDLRAGFNVHWQFAPGTQVVSLDKRRFQIRRRHALLEVRVSDGWSAVELNVSQTKPSVTGAIAQTAEPLVGVVSPGFRTVCRAPYLLLSAVAGDKPCLFKTTFLASPDA
jgi:RNA:NAD 2'-phosphotransferase (TPT1/KptA family)